jgi:hypothetical protein
MNWLRELFCRLFKWWCRKPGPVIGLKAEIDMATATLTWTLPTTRENGVSLDISEIRHTLISMSADGGATFGSEAAVLPTDPQTFVVDNLVVGNYVFRAVVEDTDGRRSVPTDQIGSVLAAPSGLADFSVVITDGG